MVTEVSEVLIWLEANSLSNLGLPPQDRESTLPFAWKAIL